MFPRKLSTLSSEVLGIEIQQEPHLIPDDDEGNAIKNSSKIGHSSVEDAATALRLYWHRCLGWERSLRYPLTSPQSCDTSTDERHWPALGMYLDGCNLPIGMRGVDFKELLGGKASTETLSYNSVRLVSKHRSNSTSTTVATVDWIPSFKSVLLPGSLPKITDIVIMFDGAKFRDITSKSKGNRRITDEFHSTTKAFTFESRDNHGSIVLEVTEDGSSADDVLFDRCCKSDGYNTSEYDEQPSTRKIIPLEQAISVLSENRSDLSNDFLSHYIVIRRNGGGSKTHRRLFDKLNLRRPNEGALCLSGITVSHQRDSLKIARELERGRVERVIECELRRRDEVRFIVVTNDVFLAERLTSKGGVLVLSYRQMEHMF